MSFHQSLAKMMYMYCCKFGLPYSEVKTEYRDYKNSGGSDKPILIKYLVNRINTAPVNIAECEHGFSKMIIVCTHLRTRSAIVHLSSLMFISISAPPLKLWKPLPYRHAKSRLAGKKYNLYPMTEQEVSGS